MGDNHLLLAGHSQPRELDEHIQVRGFYEAGLIARMESVYEQNGIDPLPVGPRSENLADGAIAGAEAGQHNGIKLHLAAGAPRRGGCRQEVREALTLFEGSSVPGRARTY